jgi:hypothetical protein
MLETWMDFNEKKNVFGRFLFMLYGLIVGWVGAPGGLLRDEAVGANQLPAGKNVFVLFYSCFDGLILGWVGASGGLLCDEAAGANQLPAGTSQERDPLDQVTHAQSHVSVFNFFNWGKL